MNLPDINWEKMDGLLPVIIQDNETGQVLMLGYMTLEALECTCQTGFVTFFSRSKKRLWKKGETSGNLLKVVHMREDCDQDSLLILVNPKGPCCHLNQPSCFSENKALFSTLTRLENLITSRYQERPSNHYTTELFEQGLKRIAQKVGEEGVEVALAACCGDKEEILNETADLVYHFMVLLVAKEVKYSEVLYLLNQRAS